MIKMTISEYCASGFYGNDNCRCIACCERLNKPYSALDEHRDWVYAQVMTGEAFIAHDAHVFKTYTENDSVKFKTEIETLFVSSKPAAKQPDKSLFLWNIVDTISGPYRSIGSASVIVFINQFFKEKKVSKEWVLFSEELKPIRGTSADIDDCKKYFDENKVLMLIDGDDLIYRFEKR